MAAKPEDRVQEAVAHLNYDFRHFTLPHFIDHLIHLRRRDIILKAFPFDRDIYGLWLRAETADYVFYSRSTHQVHATHNILHELGHIVLNHPGQDLSILRPQLAACLPTGSAPAVRGQFRTVIPGSGPEEYEAELFVRHLQCEIRNANRLEQLTRRSSSIDELDRFTRSLGYHD